MTDLPEQTLSGEGQVSPATSHGHIITGLEELDLVLRTDINWYLEMLEKPTFDEQLLRRALVRAIFAEIEAETHLMKQIAFSRHDQAGVNFKPEDLAKLKDERYPKFKENITLAFRTLAEAYSIPHELNKRDPRWNSLLESKDVRDRLIHPKESEKLCVSDSELKTIKEAHDWFSTNVRHILQVISK